MSFAWLGVFLALPLPWLLRRLLAPAAGDIALRVPMLPAVGARAPETTGTAWIAALVWLLLVCAAARPQIPDASLSRAASGRDLMIAFDVSASMATSDLRMDGRPAQRLQVARVLANDFLARRQGDRVGLIVFGSQAYLHTPLSFDLNAVRDALASAEVGLAGKETALGDAIALAVKHMRDVPGQQRVLVILTDGASNAGTLAPQRAAWLARRENLRIHAVGIGGTAAGGGDEASLKDIAAQTGGIYSRATDAAALADFWRQLDAVEPTARDDSAAPHRRELYPWPLALALMLTAWLLFAHGRERGR